MSSRVGQQFGNYGLESLLGQGGYGDVYLGRHLHLNTRVAIKVLREPLKDESVEQFRQEARLIASLMHPHIVRVLDYGIENSTPFLVMDYAPNGSLRQRHPKDVPIQIGLVVSYVKQVASALQYAHNQRYSDNRRLIHRDIKPDNMLLGLNDEVLLSDFGIAVVIQTTDPKSLQAPIGTWLYTAPEQFRGKPRRASDQYALAVVAYEWISGSCPFLGTSTELAFQHLQIPPPPLRAKVPSLPQSVEKVIFKALAKKTEERFANVGEFATALERAYLLSNPTTEESLPSGAAIYIYHGHAAPVKTVAWSPDGKRIASAGEDQTVQVWDAATGGNVHTYTTHQDVVNMVAWSPAPNSQYIASAGQDRTVQVQNTITGGRPYKYPGHSMRVNAVAWSPDGQFIASAGQDRLILVWKQNDTRRYNGHTGDVLAVAWSPDGTHLASGSQDGTIRIWDVFTRSTVRIYREHNSPVRAVAWSLDGKSIVSAGNDKKVRVWEATSAHTNVIYDGHSDYVSAVAWSPNGRLLASASYDGTVQVWSAVTRRPIRIYSFHASIVHALAWSIDGKYISSAGADSTVQVWQVV